MLPLRESRNVLSLSPVKTDSAVPLLPSMNLLISNTSGKDDLDITFSLCQLVVLSIRNLLHENVSTGGNSLSTVDRRALLFALQMSHWYAESFSNNSAEQYCLNEAERSTQSITCTLRS